MLQYVHSDDGGRRVVELRQSFQSSTPLEETDIACRGSNGFSIHGSSEIRRQRFLEMASVQDDVVAGSGRHGCKSGKVKVLPPSIAWQTASIPDARIGNDA